MHIDIISIFPEYFSPLSLSLIGKAQEKNILSIHTHDLRQWGEGVHRSVDDAPYGGGPGMVMKPQVVSAALNAVCRPETHIIVPTPSGVPLTQSDAEIYATYDHLVFLCGRYEGIDQRVIDFFSQSYPVMEVSLGDYVIFGGEAATLVIVEAISRRVPGVLGNEDSGSDDSFQRGLLEGPIYTRPAVWNGYAVPDVLREGNHHKIAEWNREQSQLRTQKRRPDLWEAQESFGT